jgi:hypothetical protein
VWPATYRAPCDDDIGNPVWLLREYRMAAFVTTGGYSLAELMAEFIGYVLVYCGLNTH